MGGGAGDPRDYVGNMRTELHNTPSATTEVEGLPSFEQWWEHLRRTGLIAAASAHLTPKQVADLAVDTYQRAVNEIMEREQLAMLAKVIEHPYGLA